MLRSFVTAVLALAFSTAACAQNVNTDVAKAPTGTYQLEQSHSLVIFSIAHMGLTDYYGRFDKLSGTLNFDSGTPEKSATNITIDTTSVDTPSERLNNELKGSGVFVADKFPTATFKSTSIVRTGPNTGKITGDLTIKDVTKPVVLDTVFRAGSPPSFLTGGGYALGFHATTTIHRADFGLTGTIWSGFVGDDVNLTIEAMFVQEKH